MYLRLSIAAALSTFLRKKPALLWLVSSHRPEQTLLTMFMHLLSRRFCKQGVAGWGGGVAEGYDIRTLKNSYNLFNSTFSEHGLRTNLFLEWAFWYILSIYTVPRPAKTRKSKLFPICDLQRVCAVWYLLSSTQHYHKRDVILSYLGVVNIYC